MVSAFYYLKRFFHVFPQRYKQINHLRIEKYKIDQKIIESNSLSDIEVENLINIIGRDSIFRKAENRKQLTLRHIAWKVFKSAQNYDGIRNKLPVLEPTEEFRKKALKFRRILDSVLPNIKTIIQYLDRVYLEQYSALVKRDFNSYIRFLHAEQDINRQINAALQPLRKNIQNLVNILELYFDYLHRRGIMEEADIVAVFGITSISTYSYESCIFS